MHLILGNPQNNLSVNQKITVLHSHYMHAQRDQRVKESQKSLLCVIELLVRAQNLQQRRDSRIRGSSVDGELVAEVRRSGGDKETKIERKRRKRRTGTEHEVGRGWERTTGGEPRRTQERATGLGFEEEIDKARARPINTTCRASTSHYKKQFFLVGYDSDRLKSPTIHMYRHVFRQRDRSVIFLLNHIAIKCLIVVCVLSQKSTNITTNNKKNPLSSICPLSIYYSHNYAT